MKQNNISYPRNVNQHRIIKTNDDIQSQNTVSNPICAKQPLFSFSEAGIQQATAAESSQTATIKQKIRTRALNKLSLISHKNRNDSSFYQKKKNRRD